MNYSTSPESESSFNIFLWRVMSLHVITYFLVGMLAFVIFSYDTLYTSGNLQNLMKPTDSLWIAAGPALQILRGILFATILWPFKAVILTGNYGWLKLWLLFVGLAILGTAGPSPGSLEGMIYTKISFAEHLIGMPEILLQTLLFSLLLFTWYRKPSKLIFVISIILVMLILLMSIGGSFVRYNEQRKAKDPIPTGQLMLANQRPKDRQPFSISKD